MPALALIWGLHPGDLATWVGSIVVGVSLLFLAWGTIVQSIQIRRQAWLDRSHQARRVGAWIEFGGESAGLTRVNMTVLNASELAVRRVKGYLFSAGATTVVASFLEIPVLKPEESLIALDVPNCPPKLVLMLVFDDDSGTRWRKYESLKRPLRQMKPRWKDLHKLKPVSGSPLTGG